MPGNTVQGDYQPKDRQSFSSSLEYGRRKKVGWNRDRIQKEMFFIKTEVPTKSYSNTELHSKRHELRQSIINKNESASSLVQSEEELVVEREDDGLLRKDTEDQLDLIPNNEQTEAGEQYFVLDDKPDNEQAKEDEKEKNEQETSPLKPKTDFKEDTQQNVVDQPENKEEPQNPDPTPLPPKKKCFKDIFKKTKTNKSNKFQLNDLTSILKPKIPKVGRNVSLPFDKKELEIIKPLMSALGFNIKNIDEYIKNLNYYFTKQDEFDKRSISNTLKEIKDMLEMYHKFKITKYGQNIKLTVLNYNKNKATIHKPGPINDLRHAQERGYAPMHKYQPQHPPQPPSYPSYKIPRNNAPMPSQETMHNLPTLNTMMPPQISPLPPFPQMNQLPPVPPPMNMNKGYSIPKSNNQGQQGMNRRFNSPAQNNQRSPNNYGGGGNNNNSNNSKRKRVPCVHFHSERGCRRGEMCDFIHDYNYEGRPTPNMDKYVRPLHMLSRNPEVNLRNMQEYGRSRMSNNSMEGQGGQYSNNNNNGFQRDDRRRRDNYDRRGSDNNPPEGYNVYLQKRDRYGSPGYK